MLRPRIIPCLLVKGAGLVKTVGFGRPKYVGDPINAVRIFNEKEVDELVVLDIDATAEGREPDYTLIRNLAAECRMPLCYGGGVSRVDQFERIVSLGVEKVSVGAAIVENPNLVGAAARCVGSQSVVVIIDARRDAQTGRRLGWVRNGTVPTGLTVTDLVRRATELGAGEVVVNNIDLDGSMTGYDLDLAREVGIATSLPVTFLGGAGSLAHIRELFRAVGVVGAAAGSLFVFKGSLRAVLINYPRRSDRDELCLEVANRSVAS